MCMSYDRFMEVCEYIIIRIKGVCIGGGFFRGWDYFGCTVY